MGPNCRSPREAARRAPPRLQPARLALGKQSMPMPGSCPPSDNGHCSRPIVAAAPPASVAPPRLPPAIRSPLMIGCRRHHRPIAAQLSAQTASRGARDTMIPERASRAETPQQPAGLPGHLAECEPVGTRRGVSYAVVCSGMARQRLHYLLTGKLPTFPVAGRG